VLNSERRAGVAISAAGRLLAVSVGAGLLLAAVTVPVVGALGVATRNAANTFNTLKVPTLGTLPSRSEILTASGKLIAYYYPNNIYRIPVSYDQIAPDMRQAIVAIEDNRYWLHGAFDLRGTVRAAVEDLNGEAVQGGSTIAQEYVKNALILTATTAAQQQAAYAQTIGRKVRELRMAANVEREMTKQQLLAALLNAAFYDNGAVGIQVAAQRYFSVDAAQLNLPQAALLAGLVRNPNAYNPVTNPQQAIARRNVVLERMAQIRDISEATAKATEKMPLGLKMSDSAEQEGCSSQSAAPEAFFCDYVLAAMRVNPAYAQARQALNTTGGLKVYTTLNVQDQHAAQSAVDYVEPPQSGAFNPGGNADTEVLIQPGTGKIRAIAEDRLYGSGPGRTTVDYAAETEYDGTSQGVQTGSSSKLFTLVTALKQGVPFGFSQTVASPANVGPYTDCKGNPTSVFHVNNDSASEKGAFTLYNGTTQSINVFYADLEQKVGLCNVVKTAVSMGLTFANGGSLLKSDRALGQGDSADANPSFTLGVEPVAPMSMAAAYATVAARGVYCTPIAIGKILSSAGKPLPVASAGCHRVLSTEVADAASHVLQGVLASPGTAANRGIGVPAAGKTGTSDTGFYAAFGGYTPDLAGYVSVFNPVNPTTGGAMLGFPHACYREDNGGGENCPGQMFGDNAPGATWQMTFEHAQVGDASFVGVPSDSPFFSMGDGVNSPKPKKPKKPGKPRGGGLPPTPIGPFAPLNGQALLDP
jgi:membrane peptidoglycan carboxypeptidase